MKPATNNYINFWNCALGDNSKFANLAKAVVEEQSAEIQELETQLAAKDAEFERKLAGHIKDREEAIAAKDAVIAKLRQELFCAGVEPINYNDDSALQELLKQAKRELLVNLADHSAFAAGQVEMRERAAIESWQHYMKACQMQNFSAGEFGAFIAAASIRALPIEGEK